MKHVLTFLCVSLLTFNGCTKSDEEPPKSVGLRAYNESTDVVFDSVLAVFKDADVQSWRLILASRNDGLINAEHDSKILKFTSDVQVAISQIDVNTKTGKRDSTHTATQSPTAKDDGWKTVTLVSLVSKARRTTDFGHAAETLDEVLSKLDLKLKSLQAIKASQTQSENAK
jgi:hypothetical protein